MDVLTWQVFMAGVLDQMASSQTNDTVYWQRLGVFVSGTSALVTFIMLLTTWRIFLKTHGFAHSEHQATYRIDLQRLLLDVNKVMIGDPDLLALCGVKLDHPIKTDEKKQTAFAFLLMNTFETVTSYYINSSRKIKKREAGTWRAWANWLHHVLREVPLSRRILELEKEKCEIYERKFWDFCKTIADLPEEQLNNLEPWNLCTTKWARFKRTLVKCIRNILPKGKRDLPAKNECTSAHPIET